MAADRYSPKTLAVARVWSGRTRPEMADAYERFNYDEGIQPPMVKADPVQTFRRDGETGTWFTTTQERKEGCTDASRHQE